VNKKVTCKKGSISQALKHRQWTKQELANKAKCDRRTISNADAGKEVRFRTVQQIAGALKCSTDTLLTAPYLTQLNEQHGRRILKSFTPSQSDTSIELLIKTHSAAHTAKSLMELHHVLVWFDIPSLDPEQKSALTAIDRLLTKKEEPRDHYSIQGQLRAMEKHEKLATALHSLEQSGLNILMSRYNFWSRSESSRNRLECSLFQSALCGVLVLTSNRMQNGLVIVNVGEVVPEYSDGLNHIYVDGRKLSPPPTP
jgi:transcriptional regulator with XRE-family HTH domain